MRAVPVQRPTLPLTVLLLSLLASPAVPQVEIPEPPAEVPPTSPGPPGSGPVVHGAWRHLHSGAAYFLRLSQHGSAVTSRLALVR